MEPSQLQMWDAVAASLEYPGANSADFCRLAVRTLAEEGHSELSGAIEGLVDYLADAPHGEPEERYTMIFDLKPVCNLYVGWHLFQDTYARGALLAGLAEELRLAGVVHKHDLPDYLPTLLRLAPRMSTESRAILVHGLILKGLEKIEEGMAEVSGPWAPIVCALRGWLTTAVPRGEAEIPSLHRPLEVIQC